MEQISEHIQDEGIQETTAAEILRIYGSQFNQINGRYSDQNNGRCAIGVLSSYFGWDGKDKDERMKYDSQIRKLIDSATEVKILELNDSGKTFDEIADLI